MNKLICTMMTAVFAMGLQAPSFAATGQQNKMKTCNAEAGEKGLKGDERKAFMKDCLSAKKEEPADAGAKTAQQDKMKSCNADAAAKSLKGDERKAFMKDCLKK